MSLLLPYICLNCKSFPFTILFPSLFMQGKNVLRSCLYNSGCALGISLSETDIVKAIQPPSMDTIIKFYFHTIMRC